jgi:hypothetical protein
MIKERIVTRRLPCRLTRLEALDRAQRLVELLDALNDKLKEKAQVLKDFGIDIKDLQGEVNGMRLIVKHNEENRTVDCRELFDFRAGLVHLVRLDTGDEVGDPRHITNEERQLNYFNTIEELDPTPLTAAPPRDETAAELPAEPPVEAERETASVADEPNEFTQTELVLPDDLPDASRPDEQAVADPLLDALTDESSRN